MCVGGKAAICVCVRTDKYGTTLICDYWQHAGTRFFYSLEPAVKEVSSGWAAAVDMEEQTTGCERLAGHSFIFFCVSQEMAAGLFGKFKYICPVSSDSIQIWIPVYLRAL